MKLCYTPGMKLTAQIKLLPTPEQAQALRHTLEMANTACNYIRQQAWESQTFRQFPLHKLTYYAVKEMFALTAQVIVRCISKVADAYKLDNKNKRTFKLHGAIAYDGRILTWHTDKKMVSIWTVAGRASIPFTCGKRQLELLQGQRGESDLCLVKGKFYLFAVCDVETPKPMDVEGVLGIDLGVIQIAATSDGGGFSGGAVEDNRRKFAHRRRNLQRNGSKSAKRKLKKISGVQSRFQKITHHRMSKILVQIAYDTHRAMALEDLGGIREAPVRRKQRARLAHGSFFQLRSFIAYKAERRGVPLIFVEPAYTSQTCPACGGVDRANRKSQSVFLCTACNFSGHADTVASLNIRDRAIVHWPMVSSLRA